MNLKIKYSHMTERESGGDIGGVRGLSRGKGGRRGGERENPLFVKSNHLNQILKSRYLARRIIENESFQADKQSKPDIH